MRRISSIVAAVFALLGGCGTHDARRADAVTLRMEVAYSYFGNVTGTHRIWAIERVPRDLVQGLQPDDQLTATVACKITCSVVSVSRLSDSSSSMTIRGRLHGAIDGEPDALLILQPFPMEPSQDLFRQLDYQEGVTKIVEVRYRRTPDKLEFQDLKCVGTEKREPITWK